MGERRAKERAVAKERRAPDRPPEERLPHSIEAEKAVLGALLVAPEVAELLPPALDERAFFRDAHRRIFGAMLRLRERRVAVDTLTVWQELSRTKELEEVGGPAYLSSLADGVPRSINAAAYAETVIEHRTRRDVIHLANTLLRDAYLGEAHGDELLASAQRGVIELATQDVRGGPVAARSLVHEAFTAIERAQVVGTGAMTGLPTGFRDLDALLCGLQPGDLILVAARPSMGKTSFALEVAKNVALTLTTGVSLVFSLEMSAAQLTHRMLTSEARIDGHRLRAGFLSDRDYQRIGGAMARLADARLLVDDTAALPVEDMLVRARRAKLEHGGVPLLVVDYLQLMATRERHENRQQQVSAISRSLKAAAKELGVPLMALSQLSRAPEGRRDSRPVLSDLRESGALEQDADVVLFLWHDDDDEGVTEVIVGKNRNGPTGTVKLAFLKEFTRFEDLAPQGADDSAQG